MCGPGPDKVGPTYDQRVQSEINNEMWQYYQNNYKPLVDKYAQRTMDSTTNTLEKKQVTGKVNADIMKQAKPVSPNSTLANRKHMVDVADMNAMAQVSGKEAVKVRQIGEQQNLINIGRGQTTKAMSGLDALASMSVDNELRSKEREMRTTAAQENAIGSAVGAAAGLAASAANGARSITNRTKEGALIYGSPEYDELAKKWG